MSRFIHADRPLVLQTPLGSDVFLPIKVSGVEAMSTPYRFKLELLAEDPVDFDRLLGNEATLRLTLPGSAPREVHGILRRLKEGRRVPGPSGPSTFLRYRADLVAPLWRLSRRVQSRVLRADGRLKNSVPDILRMVLHDEWRLRVTFRLSGQYAARDHAVQYRESDLAFVSRLMEEEGIYYYFNQDEQGCEMVVTDAATGCRPAGAVIAFDDVQGGTRPTARIRAWEKEQEVRAVRHTLRDYSFQKPHSWLEGQQAMLVPERVAVGKVEHLLNRGHSIDGNEMFEVYDYPGGYAHRFDGTGAGGEDQGADLESLSTDKDRTVRLRMQEEAARCLKLTGGSDVPGLSPGHHFRLGGHASGDGVYLPIRVEHEATQPIVASKEVATTYSNTFACLPEGLPYRPRRKTAQPRIDGTQTAVVVGPSGAKTFVDRFGRIKVQFHWDRTGRRDASSSCWVRVAQTWAGARIGAFFWPRVGDEVVIAFEEGDPDRPLVVGSVYNAQNMPPFELPESVLTSGFKSGSLNGDPLKDFNGLLFHDHPGHETVQLHGQTQTVQTDETRKEVVVGRYQRTIVGGPFLHIPGSGSGGGDLGLDLENFKKAWGNMVQYGYGHSLLNFAGLTIQSTLGGYVTATLNPFALMGLVGKETLVASAMSPAWKSAFGIGSVAGGFCSYTVGASSLMTYGSSLITGHGFDLKNFAPLTSLQKKLVFGISLCQVALTLAPMLGASYGPDKKNIAGRPGDSAGSAEYAEWAIEAAAGVLLEALATTERLEAIKSAGEEKTRQNALDVQAGNQIAESFGPDGLLRDKHNAVAEHVRGLRALITPGVTAADHNFTLQGVYNLTARRGSFVANNPNGDTRLLLESSSTPPEDGELEVRSSGDATIEAGLQGGVYRSRVQLLTPIAVAPIEFGLTLDSLDGVRLRTHRATPLGHPHIDLKEQKILIHSGGANETTGPRIILDSAANTITLACAAGATAPRIVVGNAGIEIFGTGGAKIDVNALVTLTKDVTSLTVRADRVEVS